MKEWNKSGIEEDFRSGLDCSQVVLAHYAEQLGITVEEANRAAAAFGGGMGVGETCGAVVGAMIALGLRYGPSGTDDMDKKQIMDQKRKAFIEEFLKKHKSCACRDVLGYDVSDPDDLKIILEKGLLFDFCPELVLEVAEITDALI